MDWASFLIDFLINLGYTVIIYLLVPVILILRKKKYTQKKIKKITIINCIVCWLFFQIVAISLGGEPRVSAAVFLWGGVGYALLKQYCWEEFTFVQSDIMEPSGEPITAVEQESMTSPVFKTADVSFTEHRPSPTTEAAHYEEPSCYEKMNCDNQAPRGQRYCKFCGNSIDSTTKKCTGCGKQYFKGIAWRKIALCVLTILLIASVACNIYLLYAQGKLTTTASRQESTISDLETAISQRNNAIDELQTKVSSLTKKNSDLTATVKKLNSTISANAEKNNFFDTYIVFVEDDGTNLYHKYECDKFVGNYFWAFNTEAAQSKGYKPCSDCH